MVPYMGEQYCFQKTWAIQQKSQCQAGDTSVMNNWSGRYQSAAPHTTENHRLLPQFWLPTRTRGQATSAEEAVTFAAGDREISLQPIGKRPPRG